MSEYEQLSKGQSRVAYTRRIMEIVANIQKQKEDIGRILADTRKVCLYLSVCGMSNHACVCVCLTMHGICLDWAHVLSYHWP